MVHSQSFEDEVDKAGKYILPALVRELELEDNTEWECNKTFGER